MASENELLIRLGVDGSNASTQLKAIKKELKSLDDQMKLVNDSTLNYNKKSESMTKQLQLQQKMLKAYEAELEANNKALKENFSMLDKKEQKLKELESAENKNTAEIEKARKEVSKYTEKVERSRTDIETTTLKIEAMNRAINAQHGALAKLSFEKMSKGLKTASEMTEKMSHALAPVSTALTGALGASIKTAMDFETAITQVAVTSQASAEDLERLKNVAIELGEKLPISSSAVAEGMNYLALAGYNVEEQLTAIEPIAKASVAWNADLATVSDLATDSLSAMGLTASDLAHYLDVASMAQSKSNTTATSLMEAYVEVGGSLKNLNIPLEESTTWLGILA